MSALPALADDDDNECPWYMLGVCIMEGGARKIIRDQKKSMLDDFTSDIIDGVNWISGSVGDSMKSSGAPDLTKDWFREIFASTTTIALLCALAALLCALIYAALTRDGREIGRTLASVLLAGLSTGFIVTGVGMANSFVDYLCDIALGKKGWAAVTDSLRAVAEVLNKSASKEDFDPLGVSYYMPSLIIVIIGLVMILLLGIIWLEMIIRRIATDVAVAFWPISAAGSIWPKAREWKNRLADTIIVVLLAKPVIIVVLMMGAGSLRNAHSAADLILACGLYALAAFAPYLVMTMIGAIGGGFQPGGSGAGMRQAGIGGLAGMAAGAAALAGGMAKLGPMIGGGSTPQPSAAGQAAAGQAATQGGGGGGGGNSTSLTRATPREMLSAGSTGGSGAPALDSGGSGGRPVLEGKIIPGQLTASPARKALPPGPSSSGGGTPPPPTSPAPAASTAGGGGKYAPPSAPPRRTQPYPKTGN
ncbi:hypothetical protein [Streptomyces celluloflavus]|uniref:hypothetical protein n=1 Tax=Streptomyces celluloflavus TaxID=58344 RepID=UPI0036785147